MPISSVSTSKLNDKSVKRTESLTRPVTRAQTMRERTYQINQF
jgi:hypothetical protein